MKHQKWEAKFIAVLASEQDVSDIGRDIFVNTSGTPQFSLKIISYEPADFPRDVRYVTCYAEELVKWGFEDNIQDTHLDRCQAVRDFLQDSLLVFQPERRVSKQDFREHYVATNVTLVGKKDNFSDTLSLIPVPVFYEQGLVTLESFRTNLLQRKHVGNNFHVSSNEEDTHGFILFRGKDRKNILFGEFDSHTVAHGGYRFLSSSGVRELELGSLLEEAYEKEGDSVLFFPVNVHEEILEMLNETPPISLPDDAQEAREQAAAGATIEAVETREEQFLEELKRKTKEMGLFYSDDDLYNFHTALKTQSLVILAGMSGTGKSQLVNAYAKALRLPSSQVAFISVRPSWTDDTDLIGYPDTLNNVYRPGDSGLVNTLIRAKKESDKLFFVCFDEMNLARVEHYFSQFLSILETDTRTLKLYNEDLQQRFYNSEQYEPNLTIGDNVFFLGTVNIDETTHQFSDKVLDRANVIELAVLPFHRLLDIEEEKKSRRTEELPYTTEDFWSKGKQPRTVQLTEVELSFLWDMHQTLQNVSLKMGIGPRIVRQIDRYLYNMPDSTPFTRRDAFDKQVVQRVLTKVRGAEDVLLPLVGVYRDAEDTVVESELFQLFNRYSEVSEFIEARMLLIAKARELKRNGYTM
ncbi:McrB family protein [Sutcliffiella rhizosphaerae]|uniref:ATPase dynein-related AAA domain-containing protein n=1 Tax=Sutcliffiella rhizosphaerae TaxID=2880967 RepID=A0ABM8YTE7_9BACI|nr:AAA family ATPase [Sutcliffiella rhizosphaerae]CAG9623292.1 hypothetical protein BACCIP111883_04093 [Sutcliffiella rhizosphaerae]